tara:strand:- start:741 stop:1358 length:618 start_codon:yes stop_codon:yes gene_type:complete
MENILFDFDGVIINSVNVRTEGLKQTFQNYSKEKIEKLEIFHLQNRGLTKREKIKFFYNSILNKKITSKKIDYYSNEITKNIGNKLENKKLLINDTFKYINKNYKKINMHIVSACEHKELINLTRKLNIEKYFCSINGSPQKKNLLIKEVLITHKYKNKNTIYIGDAINDYFAAKKNNIEFYGFNNIDLKNKYGKYIDSFDKFNI